MEVFNNHQFKEEELIKKGYKKYLGKDMSVYFNGEICTHSGNCVGANAAVFNPKRRPWIIVDKSSQEEIKEIIDHCPSGALQYEKER